MAKVLYQPGDTIILKVRVPEGSGRVVSVFPETQGSPPRYRVRFQNENFERNIAQDEIDTDASIARMRDVPNTAPVGTTSSSWINSNAIRTKK